MTTAHDIRVLTRSEDVAAAAEVFRTAMVGLPLAVLAGDVSALTEPGRTLGAFADGTLIGGADSYTSWLTVPGGARVPHAAVTHVGVLPTHTRRGVVSALMRAQLADIAARGEVVASLRASEAVIYERFGFGIATWAADYELDRRRGILRGSVASDAGRMCLADPVTSGKVTAGIYAKAAWTGSIDRPEYWWHQRALFAEASPGPRYLAVHGSAGDEDGYVAYHPVGTDTWFRSRDHVIVVDDLIAHTEAAYLGLIRHLSTLDLVDTVRLPGRPVDDELPLLFTDTRAVRQAGVHDETWLRLVDVAGALAARSYPGGGSTSNSVVIEVTDEILPVNNGRYRVSPDGATRTDEAAGISLDVAALAAAYLGGTRLTALARAGRATEHVPGELARADALFATARAPFAGTSF